MLLELQFRDNLNVLGPLTAFVDSTFEQNLIVNDGIYTYGSTNQMDGSLNIIGSLATTGNSKFLNKLRSNIHNNNLITCHCVCIIRVFTITV